MTEYLGNVTVPTFADSGETFPIVPDWGYGYAQAPHVVIHYTVTALFGYGSRKAVL